jgi:hypothetical protein
VDIEEFLSALQEALKKELADRRQLHIPSA